MTIEQKNKVWKFFERLIPLIITPSLLVGMFFTVGGWKQSIEERTFPTSDAKTRTLDHVDQSLNPVELFHLKEHITDPNVHMPKNAKDSIYVTRKEFEELYGRTAVQIYQINQKLEELIHEK